MQMIYLALESCCVYNRRLSLSLIVFVCVLFSLYKALYFAAES